MTVTTWGISFETSCWFLVLCSMSLERISGHCVLILDGVAPLVTDPPPSNSTNDIESVLGQDKYYI